MAISVAEGFFTLRLVHFNKKLQPDAGNLTRDGFEQAEPEFPLESVNSARNIIPRRTFIQTVHTSLLCGWQAGKEHTLPCGLAWSYNAVKYNKE